MMKGEKDWIGLVAYPLSVSPIGWAKGHGAYKLGWVSLV